MHEKQFEINWKTPLKRFSEPTSTNCRRKLESAEAADDPREVTKRRPSSIRCQMQMEK